MRVLRTLVLILGLILIVIGVSQPIFADFWYCASKSIVQSAACERIAGAFAVIFGLALILAAVNRVVAIPGLVFVLGVIMFLPGIYILFRPDIIAVMTNNAFLNRPSGERRLVLLYAGIIRAIIGVVLVAAVVNSKPLPEQ